MDIKNVYDAVIFASAALTVKDALLEAVRKGVNLRRANLREADLCGANLCEADLYGANLCEANLCGANLRGASLRGANLCGANLRRANLRGADLCGANLCEANLCGANLRGAKNAEKALARVQFIPEEGSFIGWKKCSNGIVAKLLIPEDAKRSHGSERKCRADKVTVLEIFGAEFGKSGGGYKIVEYRKGETVVSDSWDKDRWNVCSHGIHFFLTRIEAEEYQL